MRTRSCQSHHCGSVPVRVIFASVIIALVFPALIPSLPCLSQCDPQAESIPVPSHHSIMVVRYACMACCPTYFMAYQRAGPRLLFIMPAPQPVASPSEASPLLYCARVQLTWMQAQDLGLLGCGTVWAGPPKNASGRPHSPYPSSVTLAAHTLGQIRPLSSLSSNARH